MLNGAVARRYAQALLEIGIETNSLNEMEQYLGRFVNMLDNQDDLRRVLYHPSVVMAEKKELVNAVLKADQFPETVRAFILLVIERRRENYFIELYQEFVRLANQIRNIVEARVTSAVELSEAQVERLKEQLRTTTGKQVVLHRQVDPSLLGGLVVAFGDRIIDGSVAGKIRSLKESLQQIPLPSLP
ncbi:F0F1 ATP synthase subunit delta [Heliobacillus mobilis]|uniref:ATP synthase subunit delta n=1 Tax=Heliobacterium mobile TaxID=28064 RepID=A0A6I3SL06_HELMO|nr:F0F1 ATP synthase subunit delta [Heliobacterium mobile]MTV49580.1 F0F1 ATP synthase subunit delta [Heliobacterium mobile]